MQRLREKESLKIPWRTSKTTLNTNIKAESLQANARIFPLKVTLTIVLVVTVVFLDEISYRSKILGEKTLAEAYMKLNIFLCQ